MDDHALPRLERVQQLALREFQKVLRENLAYRWKSCHGQPPNHGYVEQKSYSKEPWQTGNTLQAWNITADKSVLLTSPNNPPAKRKTDGMFFDLLVGFFGVSVDWTHLSIHWQTGPRFGRGFVYVLEQSADGALWLARPQSIWVS